nr:type pilus assembly protein PilM [Aeromicrobium sp.]
MARTLVGLDIGSSGLRAAEFSVGNRRLRLRRFAQLELPAGVVRAGTVVDPDALTAALVELWSIGRFRSKTVALGVANAGVLVRQMDLDWMAPSDFSKALRYQVEDALPMAVDDANLDYHLLDDVEVPGEDGAPRRVARVLLVAAAREMVDAFVGAVDRAGLRAVSVDLVPFALVRSAVMSAPSVTPDDAPLEALVDIGFDVVTLVVHQSGQPRYVRMLPGVGSDAISQAIRERYDWTWEEAERTKVVVGLAGHSTLKPEVPRADGLDHPAQRVVGAEAEALASEIATTLDYVRDADRPDIARVLLAGAGSRLAGLPELFEERLGVPVERMALTDRVRRPLRGRDDESDDISVMIAAGLCLRAKSTRGVGRPSRQGSMSRKRTSASEAAPLAEAKRKHGAQVLPSVNLLSPWAFERIAVRQLRTRFAISCLMVVSAAVAAWGLQSMRIADAEDLLTVENAETSRLTERTNVLQPVRTFIAGVEQQKVTVSEAMASEIYFSNVLDSMSEAVPAGAVLDSLVVTLAPPPPAPVPAPAEEGSEEDSPTPAPAVPAVASPCPGPDPFQTLPVVGCITLSGSAGSRAEVGAFVVALGADESFVEPFISTTTTADAAKVTFSGSVGLSEKVFSARYAALEQMLVGKG